MLGHGLGQPNSHTLTSTPSAALIEISIDHACPSVRMWGCTVYEDGGAERRGAQTIDPSMGILYKSFSLGLATASQVFPDFRVKGGID